MRILKASAIALTLLIAPAPALAQSETDGTQQSLERTSGEELKPARLLDRAEAAIAAGRMIEARWLLDGLNGRGTVPKAAVAPIEARYAVAAGDLAAAGTLITEQQAEASQDCRWRVARGALLSAQGKIDEAIDELGGAAADCTLDAASWQLLAVALSSRNEARASIYAFRRALALTPESVAAHTAYGHALIAFGRHDEARKELDMVVRSDPSNIGARNDRDLLAGILDEDIERQPTDSDERWAERLTAAARGAQQAGDEERARALAARAVMAAPSFDPSLYARATGE